MNNKIKSKNRNRKIMKLREFIKNFSHNNVIRLVYKNERGYEIVLEDWNDVSMDHEITNGKGKNRHYIDNEVLGLTNILFQADSGIHYPEAINIVIERLENQPYIEETINQQKYYEQTK